LIKKILLTSIVAISLIFSGNSFVQNVQALTITLSDEQSCLDLGGTWDPSFSVCTINGMTINNGEHLVIDKVTLFNTGVLINNGMITVQGSGNAFVPGELTNNGGTIINNGTIELNGDAASNSGRIRNQAGGTIENNGILNANGGAGSSSASIAMLSLGSIVNNGTITLNSGSGTQSGKLSIDPGTTLTNNGIINNNSLIQNFGTIDKCINSTISGTGDIDPIGTINEDIVCNVAPDCSNPDPSQDTIYQDDTIWPPNHKMENVSIVGITDPDGDTVTITIDSIFQDEPTNGLGDGDQSPDGDGIGTDTAQVRAERSGEGDGRIYHIGFTADDDNGGSCSSEVLIKVPHDKKSTAVDDDGSVYDSTLP